MYNDRHHAWVQYVSQSRLLDIISYHYDQNELIELCFRMGVNYEELPGGTLRTKAISLINYTSRRGRLAELVTAVMRTRHGIIHWYDIMEPVYWEYVQLYEDEDGNDRENDGSSLVGEVLISFFNALSKLLESEDTRLLFLLFLFFACIITFLLLLGSS